eukprot:COSAG01_NODE_18270_length_1087_cov_1.791498_1_plen_103_part_00
MIHPIISRSPAPVGMRSADEAAAAAGAGGASQRRLHVRRRRQGGDREQWCTAEQSVSPEALRAFLRQQRYTVRTVVGRAAGAGAAAVAAAAAAASLPPFLPA